MKGLLIRGGRVIDPGRGIDEILDVLVADGKIAKIGRKISHRDAEILNAAGLVVAPGFIDMHVHLREPGMEYKETIESGTSAAVAGGFTAVCCMPNTDPVNDDPSITRFILEQAARVGAAHVYPVGAISKGLQGEKLAEFGLMREAGIVAVSDDGRPIQSSELMRRALEYSRMFDMPVIDHCEDKTLAPGWIAHEGWIATKLGLRGMPAAGEIIPIQRDLTLLKLAGGRLHIAHVSTEGGVQAIREAKRAGLPVTAEAAPHHFTLSETAVENLDTRTKMSPPLRTERDVEAVIEGIRDGTIDTIASDHAPHHEDEKNQEFDNAPFGVIGLETTLPVTLDRLVKRAGIDLKRVIEMFTVNPAAILGLPKGTLAPGADADITIFHPTKRVTIDVERFRSKSRNSPFHGMTFEGSPAMTIVGGAVRYRKEKI